MDFEEENHGLIQASTQILIHSLGHAQKFEREKYQFYATKIENERLSKLLKDSEAKRKKEIDSKDATISFLRHEVQEYNEHRQILCDTKDNLTVEITSLKAHFQELEDDQQNGWIEEKKKLKDTNFERGFNFYLTGFLANDPTCCIDKFGQEKVDFIEEFKVEHAPEIKKKRIELGYEVAPAIQALH